MLTIIKPFQKTFAFSYTESLFWIRFFLFRVRVFKSQVRVFFNTSPDFFRVRVRVFLESGFSSSPSPGPSPSPVRVSKYAAFRLTKFETSVIENVAAVPVFVAKPKGEICDRAKAG
jgi:hypothetical protein